MAKFRENKDVSPRTPKVFNKKNSNIIKLIKRKDFLAIGTKHNVRVRGLNLQARKRSNQNSGSIRNNIRVGFTCSKKVGNAVRRNSAKRRLRHVARECLPCIGKYGWDYNLIGHYKYTEEMNFADLKRSFIQAINQIHKFEKTE